MKRIISILLLLSLAFTLVSCRGEEQRALSCSEVIKAYEDAGYYVVHGSHNDDTKSTFLCYVKAYESEDPGSDFVYFTFYFMKKDANDAKRTDQYNIIKWILFSMLGESRWLKVGTYGAVEYTTYNKKLLRPFNELIK